MSTLEFGDLLTSNAQYLRGFALKFTRDGQAADDLLQDTFLKAFRYKDNFQEGTNIKGWLYTIMRNIFINNYKRKVFQNTITDSTDNNYYINSSLNFSFDSISSQISEKDIWKEINDLSDDYRIPFSMFLEGYHYDEIADTLQIPMGTVKSRIFHARKKLTRKLKDFRF
ncbi:RNA polymerase sigma factor [Halocola ammonii]